MKTSIKSRTENQAECLKIANQVAITIGVLIETSEYAGEARIEIEPYNNGYQVTVGMNESTSEIFLKYNEKTAEYILQLQKSHYIYYHPISMEFYFSTAGSSCTAKTAKEILNHFAGLVTEIENAAI